MSYKILQNKGYIKGEELDSLHLYESIPEEDKGKTFNVLMIDSDSGMRDRLELLGSLTAQIMQELSLNRKDYNDVLTEQGIHIEQAQMLRTLSQFLGYFFNSTSWRENELIEYDKFEFIKRLEKVKNFFK